MEKEQFEALLSQDGEARDLGPIEDHLRALSTEHELPVHALVLCTAKIEESGPALRAVLAGAADGALQSDEEKMLAFRGLYILGGARDTQAYQPLLRLLRRPNDEIEELLGDAITEGLARIVAGIFDGDVEALFETATDRSIDGFIREALLGAATFLTWKGRIEHDRMRQFLGRFYEERLAADDDVAWIGWLDSIALLGLRDLAPLVHRAWDEGRIPMGVLERGDFESDLSQAEQAPDDSDRFKHNNLGYLDDVLGALERFCYTESPLKEPERRPPLWAEEAAYSNTPAINPWRHVGRNDPCPCRSGKKAKKCCLAT